jgi:hypothetical protein
MGEVEDRFDRHDQDEGVVKLNFKRIGIMFSVAGVVVSAFVGAHLWLGSHLAAHLYTATQGAELSGQLKQIADSATKTAQAASDTAKALNAHIAAEDLKNAKRRLDTLNEQLSSTLLWESSNHPNDISRARKADLQYQINTVKEYIECMNQGRYNCVQ